MLYKQHQKLPELLKKKKKHTSNHPLEVPLSVHAPDIPQVTARGNKRRVTGQEMCCHMYLPSPGVSFHSCEWVRRRWKPFSTPCLHSFLLNCPHKVTHGCCNMNLFPLSLPLSLSPVTLFTFLFVLASLSHVSTTPNPPCGTLCKT